MLFISNEQETCIAKPCKKSLLMFYKFAQVKTNTDSKVIPEE